MKNSVKIFATVVTLVTVIVLVAVTFINPPKTEQNQDMHVVDKHMQTICEGTKYPEVCVSTLKTLPLIHDNQSSVKDIHVHELIRHTLNTTLAEVEASKARYTNIHQTVNFKVDWFERQAVKYCLKLLDLTTRDLNHALSYLSSPESASGHKTDISVLLSAILHNQYTCREGLYGMNNQRLGEIMEPRINNIASHASNLLSILQRVPIENTRGNCSTSSTNATNVTHNEVTLWARYKGEVLSLNTTKFDLIVAKDGSGNFTNITDAVSAAPNYSKTRFVIYIKEGKYNERVDVNQQKTNITFVGDGIGRTIITSKRDHSGGSLEAASTVNVDGHGFIAYGVTFRNEAGPEKGQAVAIRVSSDLSAFYKCSFEGYQDTLLVNNYRQFFRECDIYGTVDFIFGNAIVVFQKCNIFARRPIKGQGIMITAQSREDPHDAGGIVFLNCTISASEDLHHGSWKPNVFLGRPWRMYARVVYLWTDMGNLIHPAGWERWNTTNPLEPSTVYYGEYHNSGSSSNTSHRVNWPGYKRINSTDEAAKFTIAKFLLLQNNWLESTMIPRDHVLFFNLDKNYDFESNWF